MLLIISLNIMGMHNNDLCLSKNAYYIKTNGVLLRRCNNSEGPSSSARSSSEHLLALEFSRCFLCCASSLLTFSIMHIQKAALAIAQNNLYTVCEHGQVLQVDFYDVLQPVLDTYMGIKQAYYYILHSYIITKHTHIS